jgi:hypothetical protein
MIYEFRVPLIVSTPHGEGDAILFLDYGLSTNSVWVVRLGGGHVKHYFSPDIRILGNPMEGNGWDMDVPSDWKDSQDWTTKESGVNEIEKEEKSRQDTPLKRNAGAGLWSRLRKLWIIIASFVTIGCTSYPRPYPWNFPPEEEWNQPLETSWVNLVDNWRNLTGPRKKVWNPLIQEYEPDFGSELDLLDRDLEEHELYQ